MTTHYTADFARITADPELTYTPNGFAVCKLRVAVNHSKKDKQSGQWSDIGTTWLNVSAIGKHAEPWAAHFVKGDAVQVSGQLVTREYEKRDGTKGVSLDLEYATVSKLPPMQPRGDSPAPTQPATAAAWGTSEGQPF